MCVQHHYVTCHCDLTAGLIHFKLTIAVKLINKIINTNFIFVPRTGINIHIPNRKSILPICWGAAWLAPIYRFIVFIVHLRPRASFLGDGLLNKHKFVIIQRAPKNHHLTAVTSEPERCFSKSALSSNRTTV